MITHIIKQDWWLIRSSPVAKVNLALLFVFMGIAVWNGITIYQHREATHKAIKTYEQEKLHTLTKNIYAIESAGGVYTGSPFQDPRSASNVTGKYGGRFVLYPFQPLSSWVVGQSDLYPHYYRITATKKGALVLNDEIENPQILFNGSFDVSFVIIYLLPLLIIAFTYNLAASERELGTLRMLLSEPVSVRKILAVKFVFRFLLVIAAFLAVLGLGAAVGQLPFSRSFVDFTLNALIWILFWFGLSFFINSVINKTSGATAGVLVSIWLVFVLLLPGLFSYIVNATYPVPSRIDLITETREAAEEVKKRSSQVLAKYLEDHPEMAQDSAGVNLNDFAAKFYTSHIEMENVIAPLEKAFAVQLTKQNDWVRQFKYFSPAVVMQENLNGIAGTDEYAYQQFSGYVGQYYKSLQAYYTQRVIKKKSFTAKELDSVPKAEFVARGRTIGEFSNLYFILLSVLLTLLGWVSFRQVKML